LRIDRNAQRRILGESRSRQQGEDYACLDEFPLHACSYTSFVAAIRLGEVRPRFMIGFASRTLTSFGQGGAANH